MGHPFVAPALDSSDPLTFDLWCRAPAGDTRTLNEFAADGGATSDGVDAPYTGASMGRRPRNPNYAVER